MRSQSVQLPGSLPGQIPPAPAAPPAGAQQRRRQAFAQRRPRTGALLIVTGVLCAVIVGRLHELLPALRGLPVGKILLPIGVLLLVRQSDLGGRLASFRTPQGLAFIVFVATMALSVPTSLVQGASLKDLMSFLYGPLPFVVILACAPRSVGDLAVIMKALVIALLLFGAAMLSGIGASYGDRLSGSTTYDPNDLALVAATCLPFAVFLLRDRSRAWRVTAFGGLLMLITIVTLSASRGGTIATAVVLLAMLLARAHLKAKWKIAMIGLVAVGLTTAPPVFWERVSTLTNVSSDYNLSSESGRIEIWKRGARVFAANPLTGVGLGQFATADGTFRTREGSGDRSWHTAHNAPLQVAVEIGAIGLVAFFALFVPTLRAIRRARRFVDAGVIDPMFARVGGALSLAIMAFGIGALFLSAGFSGIAMTLTALGMAYTRLLRRAVPRARAVPPWLRARHNHAFSPLGHSAQSAAAGSYNPEPT